MRTPKQEMIQKILDQYDIAEISPIKMIRESRDNFIYLVGEKNKKVVRVSKRLSAEDIHFEYDAVEYLFSNNIPVPEWIKTKNGDFYVSTKEAEVIVIFDFLEGYHAKVDRNNLPTKEQAYTAGSMLGAISEIGKNFKSSSSRKRNIFIELERVLKNENHFKENFKGGAVFVKQIKESIKFGRENNLLNGLIHNDYRPGNVFFRSDREIGGVIDFDWSCMGPIVKDFALGVLEWSFPDGREKPDLAIFDAFLDGYNSVVSEKIFRGPWLYSWIKFAALSDAATFFCDRIAESDLKKEISSSYMYKKYIFFESL